MNKGPCSQSYDFSSCHVWMWKLDHKKVECWRIDAFVLWCWRRLLRVPWSARWSNQSILKEIKPEYSLEGLLLKLSSNTLPNWYKERTHCKRPWCWERFRQEKRVTKYELVEHHHQLNGHESEQTLGYIEGQESLACCHPWGCKESDMT